MTGKTVAIVGGGLSGTLVAMRLLGLVRPPQMVRVLVIEPRPQPPALPLGSPSALQGLTAVRPMRLRPFWPTPP